MEHPEEHQPDDGHAIARGRGDCPLFQPQRNVDARVKVPEVQWKIDFEHYVCRTPQSVSLLVSTLVKSAHGHGHRAFRIAASRVRRMPLHVMLVLLLMAYLRITGITNQ